MFWQETEKTDPFRVPEDIVDLSFKLSGRQIPVDHALALSRAVQQALPWFADEPEAGLHLIHVAASGNGWIRPEGGDEEALLHLSRRTPLTLRLPQHRIHDAQQLVGAILNVAGHEVRVGPFTTRPLSALTTVFSRYVETGGQRTEEAFLEMLAAQLRRELDVRVRKLMCGRSTVFRGPDGPIETRSVMLADIEREESVRLQQRGIGPGRKLGFGLFIPHKGIAPVAKPDDRL
jgi:CRISPR-associated protein Cas6